MAVGEWIRLQVADNGNGIARKDLPHIFEPFFPFFTTKQPGHGTDLRLAQVYGIGKQHGRVIVVESKKGVGTRFTIYLPALLPERKGTGVGSASSATVTIGQGERIMFRAPWSFGPQQLWIRQADDAGIVPFRAATTIGDRGWHPRPRLLPD